MNTVRKNFNAAFSPEQTQVFHFLCLLLVSCLVGNTSAQVNEVSITELYYLTLSKTRMCCLYSQSLGMMTKKKELFSWLELLLVPLLSVG